MSEKASISRQQQKSRETKEKIFQAAKRILQKKGYEELSIKNICEEAESPTAVFIITSRQKMICCLTISRISRRSIRIFWNCRTVWPA